MRKRQVERRVRPYKGSLIPRERFPVRIGVFQPNTQGLPVPKEFDTNLMYTTAQILSTTLSSETNKAFNVNGLYDVDPALGSANVAGFSELMAMYSIYRVIGYSYEVDMVNTQDFPVLVTLVNTNDSFGGTTGLAGYAGNQYTQQIILAGKNAGRSAHKFKASHAIQSIVGSGEVELDDQFTGTVGTNPSRLVRLAIGIFAFGNTPSSGVYYTVRLKMKVRFYQRITLQN